MSIEVLDKKNPDIREEDGRRTEIYAYEHHSNLVSFMDGDSITNRTVAAYITESSEFRECTFGARKQKVRIIDGVVRGDNPTAIHKEVRERALDGLLYLPLPELRGRLTKQRVKAAVYATRLIRSALQAKADQPRSEQQLITN